MTVRTSSIAISLTALLVFTSMLGAQPTKKPTLEEILERLQANLDHYDASVPSLFCDEHVISRVEPASHGEDTITDSVFRLKRIPNPDHSTTLVESREIKTVDGKPPAKQDLDGPTMLNGAFEGGLAIVSLDQTVCMNYSLQRVSSTRPADPYIVHFATVLTPHNTAACLLKENSKGRVFIDPASMQITRLEITTPHHTIIHSSPFSTPVIGRRDLTVDYAPVTLGGKTFWMPSTITLHATSASGTYHMIVWSFRATYRDYKRLEVTSRILPDSEKIVR